MKRLFDENANYTPRASELDVKAHNTIKDTFIECAKEGYSPREVSYIIQQAVTDIELETILGWKI